MERKCPLLKSIHKLVLWKAFFFNSTVSPAEILNWSSSSATLAFYLKSKARNIKLLSRVFKVQESSYNCCTNVELWAFRLPSFWQRRVASFDSWNKIFLSTNLPYSFSSQKNLHPFLSSGPFGMALWFVTACTALQNWLHFSHQSLCRVSMWIIGVCLTSVVLRKWEGWFKSQTAA